MADDVRLSYSRTFPADVADAFDAVSRHDLARLFGRMWQGYARQVSDNIERLLVG